MLQEVTRQLETVRSRSRALMVVRRLAQAGAAVILVFLGLGLMDWLLRLPGLLRLVLVLGLAGAGLYWLSRRLQAGLAFAPSLEMLAQRAEGLYPELTGTLASAVAFATQSPPSGSSATTQSLAESTMRRAETQASNCDLKRLIDLRATSRALGSLGLALVLLLVVVVASPTWASTAWQRWMMPFGSTVWPNRVMLEIETLPDVWPSDTALPVVAQLTRGDRPGRRVVLESQWRDVVAGVERGGRQGAASSTSFASPAPIAPVVMESIGNGRYRFVIDALDLSDAPHGQTLRVWARSHDGQTQTHDLRLVVPPRVTDIRGTVNPPAYAADLLEPEPLDATRRGGDASARVLIGGSLLADFTLNQSVTDGMTQADLIRVDDAPTEVLPGRMDSNPAADLDWTVTRSDRSLRVVASVDSSFRIEPEVVNQDGIALREAPSLRVQAIADESPEVSLEALATTSLVPDAVIDLVGRARDDVGLASIQLEAYRLSSSDSDSTEVMSEAENRTNEQAAARLGDALEERQPDLEIRRALDLATLDVRPGDRVRLVARARDVFDLDGVQHDAVTARRTVNIIDPLEAERRLSQQLAQLRSLIQPAERRQRETNATLADLPSDAEAVLDVAERAAEPQARVVNQLDRVADAMAQLQRQAETNRLDRGSIAERMDQAARGLEQARRAAEAAQSALEAAQGEGRDAQGSESEADSEPANETDPEASDASEAPERDQAASDSGPDKASDSSDPSDPVESARAAQAAGTQAAEAMRALMAMLDADRASAEMNAALRQMLGQQQALAQANDAMRAQTAGRSPEQLNESERAALEALAQQQAELGEQARDLAERLDEAAEALEQNQAQDPSQSDQAAAEALRQAAETAREQQPEAAMQRAAEQMQQNQMSEASAQQAAAAQALQAMLGPMDQVQQRQQERLDTLTRELAERLQRLAAQQDQEIQDLAATPVDAPLVDREDGQTRLRQQTIDARQQAESAQETQAVAGLIRTAVEAQAQAVRSLRDDQRAMADQAERAALARLNEAIEQLAELQAQREQEAAQRERAELRTAYQNLADRQALVLGVIEPLAAQDRLSRRDRPTVIAQAQVQTDLITEADALAERVAETVVFLRLHDTIHDAGSRAATALSAARLDALTTGDLARVERALRRAAEALADPPADDPFDDGSESASEQGGGGGGGAGGESPEAVPPIAELRLLRGWQEDVMLETRAASALPDNTRAAVAERLGEDQAQLRELSESMIQQLQQLQQGGP